MRNEKKKLRKSLNRINNDEKNNFLFEKYNELSKLEEKIKFTGRLGLYKYLDMDDVIELALNTKI